MDDWLQQAGKWLVANRGFPQAPDYRGFLVPYQNKNGRLNFMIAIQYTPTGEKYLWRYALVSLSTELNLLGAYARPVLVTDSNRSRRIRTFAGDDTIHRQENDPGATIDGGLGTDTVVYPKASTDYVVSRDGSQVVVRQVGVSVAAGDRLSNIEFIRFRDKSIATDDIK